MTEDTRMELSIQNWRSARRVRPAFSFEFDGIVYHAKFSVGEAGLMVEMFLNAGEAWRGAAADLIGRECAVILSLALQFGAPLSIIAAALPKLADGSPAGPVGMAVGRAQEMISGGGPPSA